MCLVFYFSYCSLKGRIRGRNNDKELQIINKEGVTVHGIECSFLLEMIKM